LFKAF
jgi:pre-mRNA-processing factor 8